MWIRSQDGRTLVNTEHVHVENTTIHSVNSMTGTWVPLGRYQNEQVAMNVMATLHDRIANNPTGVFKMPQ